MEHGGFFETRKINPLTLGLIIAAHVVLLTALAMAKNDVGPRTTWLPTTIYPVDEPPPSPKLVPLPKHIAQRPPIERPIDLGPLLQPPIKPLTLDPPVFGKTVDPIQPPKPDPIFVQPGIDPAAAGRFQPDYPPSLARVGMEGVATVRVLVAIDGRVKQIELVSATDPAFFETTRKQALRFWKFHPGTRDGTPVESWRTMTVRFRLVS